MAAPRALLPADEIGRSWKAPIAAERSAGSDRLPAPLTEAEKAEMNKAIRYVEDQFDAVYGEPAVASVRM